MTKRKLSRRTQITARLAVQRRQHGAPFGCSGVVEEALSIRQKVGGAMPDFAARRIQTKDGYRFAAGSRNLVKGLIAHGEKDGAFGVPGRRTGVAIANRLRCSTGDHVNLLKLAIGIEAHPTAIRRPDRDEPHILGSRQWGRRARPDRAQPHAAFTVLASGNEGQPPAVR